MPDLNKSFFDFLGSLVEETIKKYIEKIEKIHEKRARLLTISELAKYSGFSEVTIRNWIHNDNYSLPAFQIGKEYRVYLLDFLDWLETYRVREKTNQEKLINFKETP
jgi:excisionase family DNA binding protein